MTHQTEKSLGSWMLHFEKRYHQYSSWIKNGEPIVMWLSGLHVPEAYITALVHTDRPQSGCYIQGLYLEGAGWDIKTGNLIRFQSGGSI